MQSSIDTGYASATKEFDSDSISSCEDYNKTEDRSSELELEWDNEPSTQILILDSPDRCMDMSFTDSGLRSLPIAKDSEQSCLSMSLYTSLENENSIRYRLPLKKDKVLVKSDNMRRRSKSLADIDLSLEEKVTLLKEGKKLVQKKIHDSIVEQENSETDERSADISVDQNAFHLRQEGMKTLGSSRVMETLRDLKRRLERQSVRLENSYTATMSLRSQYRRKEGDTVSFIETDL